jgi:hypothetical protein
VNSSFRKALKEDCHSCTDGFTLCNLLPRALSYSTCHKDKTARRRQEQMSVPRDRSETSGPCIAAVLAAVSAASVSGRQAISTSFQNRDDDSFLPGVLHHALLPFAVLYGQQKAIACEWKV